MRIRRVFLVLSTILMLNFVGCGSNSTDEAKELLNRILTLVGIPQDIVVNICQDGNDNGFCDANELQAKVTIERGDTPESIFAKLQFQADGTYLLEHYDPTKRILMEIEDNDKLDNTGQRVTLDYQPATQELSILQSLIDNNLIQETELTKVKSSSTVRTLLDKVLLENIFENQGLLEEYNLSTQDATIRNLEYIAEGLRDINISGDLVSELESCENNSSCQQRILTDANEQTEITKKDAEIIADTNSTAGTGDEDTSLTREQNNTSPSTENNSSDSSENNSSDSSDDDEEEDNGDSGSGGSDDYPENNQKSEQNAADGYIVKLTSPAIATCYDSNFENVTGTYQSNLSVGAKGLLTFSGVTLNDHCSISIASGATIDSNNNGQYDDLDKTIKFEMKSFGNYAYISPLTTLAYIKKESGEDITELEDMVKNFDPVGSFAQVESMSGTARTKAQKLLTLMEVLKTTLSDSNISTESITDINVSSIVETASGEDFSDFNIEKLLHSLPSSVKDKSRARARVMKRLMRLGRSIDKSIIDMSSFSINISDGGMDIIEALKASVKPSAPESVKTAIASANDIGAVVLKVVKKGYTPTQITEMTNYFSEIHSALLSIYSGSFNISFGDMNLSILTPSRYFGFTNLAELERVYKVYSLDDVTIDRVYNYGAEYRSRINDFNYNINYQKSFDSNYVQYKIKVNHPAKFEIVEGLDSSYFDISKGNREIAYIDLKDDIESPTEPRVYKVEIKATDVQTLESKNIVLQFKIDPTPDTNPIVMYKNAGYISKFATTGGAVLDDSNYWHNSYDGYSNEPTKLFYTQLNISSIDLIGEGSDSFVIYPDTTIKVSESGLEDFNSTSEYNLTVVIEDDTGKEFNQSLNIVVSDDSNRTVEFRDRDALENIFTRASLLDSKDNYYSGDSIYFQLLNNNPATFEIVDGLDSNFFRIHNNYIQNYNWLDNNDSLNPTYKNNEDADGDGIYEVVVKATDIQTLEESNITMKFKLVSSNLHFHNQYYNYSYEYNYRVNEETEIGGEVPYSTFHIYTAEDVNITDIYLSGDNSGDFNLTNNVLTVAHTLTQGTEYNLTINWSDSSDYNGSQNINISVGSEYATHPDLNITNSQDIHTTEYGTYWSYWSNEWRNIRTNNLANVTLSGLDENTFIDKYRSNILHSTYFYFYKNSYDYNYNEYPTYQNPKDSDQDNIYETTVTFTDIQSLQTASLDLKFEMLSHQVRPFIDNENSGIYEDYEPWIYTKELNITELSIPKYAPIGGELLTINGAKGFYTRFGHDISISTATLDGDGADNFTITQGDFGNYTSVKLAKSLADSNQSDYDLEVVISDSEGVESRHPLHINLTD